MINANALDLFLCFLMFLTGSTFRRLKSYLPSAECILCLDPAVSSSLCDQCIKELPVFSVGSRWSYVQLHKPYSLPLEVFSMFLYQWPIANMQHRFKYRRDYQFGHALAKILARYLKENAVFDHGWIIVPAPMHWWRRWQRGSNHAAIQAGVVASELGLSIAPGMLRPTRIVRPQVGLSKKQRRENLRGAFSCKDAVRGKKILIFDDIITTGSTMREMARTLYKAGATEVKGLSVARGN